MLRPPSGTKKDRGTGFGVKMEQRCQVKMREPGSTKRQRVISIAAQELSSTCKAGLIARYHFALSVLAMPRDAQTISLWLVCFYLSAL